MPCFLASSRFCRFTSFHFLSISGWRLFTHTFGFAWPSSVGWLTPNHWAVQLSAQHQFGWWRACDSVDSGVKWKVTGVDVGLNFYALCVPSGFSTFSSALNFALYGVQSSMLLRKVYISTMNVGANTSIVEHRWHCHLGQMQKSAVVNMCCITKTCLVWRDPDPVLNLMVLFSEDGNCPQRKQLNYTSMATTA